MYTHWHLNQLKVNVPDAVFDSCLLLDDDTENEIEEQHENIDHDFY